MKETKGCSLKSLNLEAVIHREVHQKEKSKYWMLTHICGI